VGSAIAKLTNKDRARLTVDFKGQTRTIRPFLCALSSSSIDWSQMLGSRCPSSHTQSSSRGGDPKSGHRLYHVDEEEGEHEHDSGGGERDACPTGQCRCPARSHPQHDRSSDEQQQAQPRHREESAAVHVLISRYRGVACPTEERPPDRRLEERGHPEDRHQPRPVRTSR
jgi:hypothetical protein